MLLKTDRFQEFFQPVCFSFIKNNVRFPFFDDFPIGEGQGLSSSALFPFPGILGPLNLRVEGLESRPQALLQVHEGLPGLLGLFEITHEA